MTPRSLFDAVDWTRIRIHQGLDTGATEIVRHVVLWLSGRRAVALGNHIFLPDECRNDVAVLAHELTHCAQYQAWGAWRYFTRGALAQVRELGHRRLGATSPYAYTVEPGKPLRAYGMEQQAQIIEDWVRQSTERFPPTAPGYSHPDPRSSP